MVKAQTPSELKALKYDDGKEPMDLVSWPAIAGLSKVLAFGAAKYDRHNWQKGMEWGRLIGATLRHVFKFSSGEDLDPETGLSHIDHAMCNLMFLSHYIKTGVGKDDRYKHTYNLQSAPAVQK